MHCNASKCETARQKYAKQKKGVMHWTTASNETRRGQPEQMEE